MVVPFANLGADPENEYFSDGLTDELLADLSRVKALKIISRTSAMLLKGANRSARALGPETVSAHEVSFFPWGTDACVMVAVPHSRW